MAARAATGAVGVERQKIGGEDLGHRAVADRPVGAVLADPGDRERSEAGKPGLSSTMAFRIPSGRMLRRSEAGGVIAGSFLGMGAVRNTS